MSDDDRMSNDEARHLFADAFGLLQDQMQQMAEIQERREELVAKGVAADGAVEVTVDAHGVVTDVTVDDAYLDDHEFEELGGHVVAAAQEAAREMERQAQEVFAPLVERRTAITDLSASIRDVPEFGEALAAVQSWSLPGGSSATLGKGRADGTESFPTVRE